MEHISVLLNESIEMLQIKEDGIYVDCTLGRGGHSSEILKRLKKGHLYAFDCDQNAIDESMPRLKAIGDNFTIIHSPFEFKLYVSTIEKKKSPKQICLRRNIRGTTQIDTRCVHLNHILSYMPTLVTGRVPGDSYLLLSKSPSKVHSPGKSYCNLTTCSSL